MSVHRKRQLSGHDLWVVRWRDGVQNRSRAFDRKRDAEAFDADLRRKPRLGELDLLDAGRQALADFAQEWWRVYAEPRLALRTLLVYTEMSDRHILPRLGVLELHRITPGAVERYEADSEQPASATRPSARAWRSFRQRCSERSSAAASSPTPSASCGSQLRRRTRAVRPLPPIAVERIRAMLLQERRLRDAALISVLAYAGLRSVEALAARWSDVGERTFLVERAAALGQLAPTKTRRTLPPGGPGDHDGDQRKWEVSATGLHGPPRWSRRD